MPSGLANMFGCPKRDPLGFSNVLLAPKRGGALEPKPPPGFAPKRPPPVVGANSDAGFESPPNILEASFAPPKSVAPVETG